MVSFGTELKESRIRDQIFEYLQKSGTFSWRDYQPTTRYQRGVGTKRKGVADILGIYRGKPLAIEVKTARGKVSHEQTMWLRAFSQHGGIAIVARSIEDVILELKKLDISCSQFKPKV